MGTGSEQYPRNEGPGSWDARIGELAGRQHGVVSRAQLRELGVADHFVRSRLRARRWYALHRGVYAVGHQALTGRSRLLAAVYACGPGALASHRAAGSLHGLMRWAGWEVSAPRGCKPKPSIVVHRPRDLRPEERALVDGIPVTSVARTLVDLADVVTEERLAKAIHQAEVLRVFDLAALERARRPGRRGGRMLARVLCAYRPEPRLLRSEAERRLNELCEEHGLPQPQFNVSVAGYEVDAYWPEANLAVEVDGARTHHTRHAFHADRRRDRVLATHGIQSLRVTWPDLGPEFAAEVGEILRRR